MRKHTPIALALLAASLHFTAAPALAHEDMRLKAWLSNEPAAITRHFEQAQVYAQLGNLWQELGKVEHAAQLFEQSRHAAGKVGEPYVRDLLIGHLANELASTRDFDQALVKLDSIEDREVWVKTAWKLIGKLSKSGDRQRAAELLKRTEKLAQSTRDPALRAELLSGTGAAYRYLDKKHGENLVYEAYGIAQMLADPYERALMYNETGAHLMDIGHRELAMEVFDEVDRLIGDIGDPLNKAKALAMLGGEQAEKNLRDRAVPALDRARGYAMSLPDGEDKFDVLSEIARNYGQSHRFEQGIATADAIGDAYHRIEGYIRIVKNMYRVGDKAQALRLLDKAETAVEAIGDPYRQAIVLRKLASEQVAVGAKARADTLLQRALEAMARRA